MDFTDADVEKEKYGEKFKYDASGPFQKTRVRTDFCWLVAFLIYLAVWIVVIIYAFSSGDFGKWIGPTDSVGRSCGKSPGVYDAPYLVQYNEESCLKASCMVCRSTCPSADFTFQVNGTDDYNLNITLEDTKSKMICQTGVKLDLVTTWDELSYLVESEMCAREYKMSIADQENRCDFVVEDYFDDWRYTMRKLNQDISNTKWSIIGFIVLSGAIALLSILLMRWYALVFVCGTIFAWCAIIFHFIYEKCVLNAESKTNGVLLALFICVVVLVLIVLTSLYFRKQIYLACQMIRESSKAIMCIISSLLFSLVLFVVSLLVLTLGVAVFFALTTFEVPVYRVNLANPEIESCECAGNLGYSQNSICTPQVFESECRIAGGEGEKCVLSGCYMTEMRSQSMGFLHVLNFIGLYWSSWFIGGFGDMVLASAFATWYWTFNKKILSYLTIVESFWRVGTYHLGTIAFGSIIMVICAIIRGMLNGTLKALMKINRPFTAVILMHLKCVFDLLERLLNFINRRAYIMCAVHGTDFLHSARMAYYLLMRNISRVIVVFNITYWLLLLLIVFISCITTRISMSYYLGRGDITFFTVPSLIIFIGSILVSSQLFRVVDLAVNTIFQCFLEDSERNDGSYDRPYFMSDELTKFLYKK